MTNGDEMAVTIRGLTVRRGKRTVLENLDLGVRSGVVTGLLGPSGCGKSTLMRSIAGVQVMAGGDVRVVGVAAGDRRLRTEVGYVTQRPSVYPDLSVRENLNFFAKVLGVGSQSVKRVMEEVALGEFADQPAGELSGGQFARISLGVALLGKCKLLILDEPTVGLDPILRRDLWQLFHRLVDDGATLLVSSHVMDEANRCDELILMRDGAVLAQEPPQSLMARTGCGTVEEAFLSLVGVREEAAV